MSTDAGQMLRDLVSDYFHGLLPREAYLKQRGALLNAAILGQPLPGALDPTRTRAAPLPFQSPGAEEVNTAQIPQLKPATAPALPAKRLTMLAAAGAAALVVAALLWKVTGESPPIPPAPVTQSIAPVEAERPPPARTDAEPRNFLLDFLEGEQAWTAAGVSKFIYEWERLTPTAKKELRATADFERFQSELRERVLDERQLGSTLETGATLESFAGLLGLDLGLPPPAPKAVVPAAVPPPPATVVAETPAGTPDKPVAPAAAPAPASTQKLPPAVSVVAPAPVPATQAPAASPVAAGAGPTPCSAQLARTTLVSRRACGDLLTDGQRGPPLIVVPAGSFQMGASDDPTARPPRSVTIPAPFAIARFEITVAEFGAFCRATGRNCPAPAWPGDEAPVVGVTWNDATDYARWLSKETGKSYRLPSEAEWEYAARGGTSDRYFSGEQPSRGRIQFGAKRPLSRTEKFSENPWGVFHMLGNVREWVADGWTGDYKGAPADATPRPANGSARVVRGGAFSDEESRVQSASRESLDGGTADKRTGFRVVLAL